MAAFVIAAPVLALPVNPTVITGTASFNQAGNILTVTNSNGAIITWKKFSIAPGDITKFVQPFASQAVLNRALNVPTAIYGRLIPSDMTKLGGIKPPVGGSVYLGSVYLIGAEVTSKEITATPNGVTILAAGATVSLSDSTTPGITVEITGAKGNTTNLGAIMAEVGRVGIAGAMVRDSARPSAARVVNEGGRIFLQARPSGQVPK